MNWALYIVSQPNDEFEIGDEGVFKTTLPSGFAEAPYGVMYIAPGKYVQAYLNHHNRGVPTPKMVKAAILDFYEEQ